MYKVNIFSLGEGCSHTAAIMFKIESAVRNGYTAVTLNLCQWNQVFSTKVRKKYRKHTALSTIFYS